MVLNPVIESFFDPNTATFTHVVSDPKTQDAAIIDAVLDYDPVTGKTATTSADRVLEYLTKNQLTLQWILETHIHADHLTAAHYLKEKAGGKIGIGSRIKEILTFWNPIFNTTVGPDVFDVLFDDGDTFAIGTLAVRVIHTPGHTPACVCYHMKDTVFVGDTIFMPDVGTARTDFPGGSAETLYESIQKIFTLPPETRVFIGHDYPAEGRGPTPHSTVKEQKQNNTLIHDGISKESYAHTRNQRDQGKPVPRLLLPSLQVNMRAGIFEKPESNGVSYVKIPVNRI